MSTPPPPETSLSPTSPPSSSNFASPLSPTATTNLTSPTSPTNHSSSSLSTQQSSLTPPAPPTATSTNGATTNPMFPPPPKGLPPGVVAVLVVGLALGALMVLIGVGIYMVWYRRDRKLAQNNYGGPFSPPPQGPKGSPGMALGFSKSSFTHEELALATNGFSDANLIGQGGFGYVHKGVLSNGKVVAVKQLKAGSGQGDREFCAEVEIISRVHHRHLVSLVGYCITGERRMLVYEFVPNNTLKFHLHGNGGAVMSWRSRVRIALGAAKGLAYLHEDCHPKIIHRDIKAANILLDESFEAKVADFGLAKFSLDLESHISTRVMGTFGYLAPEYACTGKLTEKSDVFSFGVVLLEMIAGRHPVDRTQDEYVVDWARPLLSQFLETGNFDALVDPRLEKDYNSSEMARMIACAAACVRHSAKLRPQMSQVVRALEGNLALDDLNEGMTPGCSTTFSYHESFDYSSTLYKEVLKKFRELALDTEEQDSSEHILKIKA
ncbi:hypothetical protein SLA2020_073080 [Shorea laevis]